MTSYRRQVGAVRPSHLMYTSGVGALIDLPRLSVLVRGLDDWDYSDGAGGCGAERGTAARRGPAGTRPARWPGSSGRRGGSQPTTRARAVTPPIRRACPCWCSRSGCAAPTAMSWPRSASTAASGSSRTTTPTGPTWPSSCTPTARNAAASRWRSRPGSCSPAGPVTSTTSRTGSSCTRAWPASPGRGCRWRINAGNAGPNVTIRCLVCDMSRNMLEAAGARGARNLPACRGRHPHLSVFEPERLRRAGPAADRRRVQPVVRHHLVGAGHPAVWRGRAADRGGPQLGDAQRRHQP